MPDYIRGFDSLHPLPSRLNKGSTGFRIIRKWPIQTSNQTRYFTIHCCSGKFSAIMEQWFKDNWLLVAEISLAASIATIISVWIAIWQWLDARRKGRDLEHFLLGLKGAELPERVVNQINDMLARLKRGKRG